MSESTEYAPAKRNQWDELREHEVRRNKEFCAALKEVLWGVQYNASWSRERAYAIHKIQEAIFWLESGHTFS